jgi:adenosine deaminase
MKKIELHVHLEGTMRPSLALKLAARNGIKIKKTLINSDGTRYLWNDFNHFLMVFDEISQVLKTPKDYFDITYDYLADSAKEQVIYTELMYSPDHAEIATNIPSKEHIAAICSAIDKAYDDYGIIARILITAVRHYGVKTCEKAALDAARSTNPYIVGFAMGGDEVNYPPKLFEKTYHIAHDAGLSCTIHSGEHCNAQSMHDAISYLPLNRIGHGVAATQSPRLIQLLIEKNIALECCPSSNIELGLFSDYQTHPLQTFYESGISVSINSDDPPYFNTTIGKEYELAHTQCGLSIDDINNINMMAINAAFISDSMKARLHQRLK